MNNPLLKPEQSAERRAATQITDMMGYSTLTASMSPAEIRDFIIAYQRKLKGLINNNENTAEDFTPLAGDSSVTIYPFESHNEQDIKKPLHAAIRINRAAQSGELLPTRLGIYAGNIIEAPFDEHTLSFGNAFAAAARLEQLCNYFNTGLLFDREIARSDKDQSPYMISIGKVTPKNFLHPIHIYSIYKPGINNCPLDIDNDELIRFIALKNEAMDYFTGNALNQIACNFPMARTKLIAAARLFEDLTGRQDLPTQRILEYIDQNPHRSNEFTQCGMKIRTSTAASVNSSTSKMPEKLLLALDHNLYQTLVHNTEWENYFHMEWRNEGEVIIHAGETPDAVYYIESGNVLIKSNEGEVFGKLKDGEIFGEKAYFSQPQVRTAQVIAATNLVLQKISGEDFNRFPQLRRIFSEIAAKRQQIPTYI